MEEEQQDEEEEQREFNAQFYAQHNDQMSCGSFRLIMAGKRLACLFPSMRKIAQPKRNWMAI